MKKWENPELMILGVEHTKEEVSSKLPYHYCLKCKNWIKHDEWWNNHDCRPAEPGEGPLPLPTPSLS